DGEERLVTTLEGALVRCHRMRHRTSTGSLIERRPLRIGGVDQARDVLPPQGGDGGVEGHVELPVHDLPAVLGTDVQELPLRHPPGAEAAVLRRVLRGIRHEGVAMLAAREEPFHAAPFEADVLLAGRRLAVGEVGNRVVALDAEPRVERVEFMAGAVDGLSAADQESLAGERGAEERHKSRASHVFSLSCCAGGHQVRRAHTPKQPRSTAMLPNLAPKAPASMATAWTGRWQPRPFAREHSGANGHCDARALSAALWRSLAYDVMDPGSRGEA